MEATKNAAPATTDGCTCGAVGVPDYPANPHTGKEAGPLRFFHARTCAIRVAYRATEAVRVSAPAPEIAPGLLGDEDMVSRAGDPGRDYGRGRGL